MRRLGIAAAALISAMSLQVSVADDGPLACPQLDDAFARDGASEHGFAVAADPADWPWYAAIRHRDARSGVTYFCGGARIAPDWVVTAANCVSAATPSQADEGVAWRVGVNGPLEVAFGVGDLRGEAAGETIRQVSDVVIHPGFQANIGERGTLGVPSDDIALVRLDRPHHGPVLRYATRAASDPGEDGRGFTAGFGGERAVSGDASPLVRFSRADGDFARAGAPLLRQALAPIIDERACRAAYPDLADVGQFCAGFSSGGLDACQVEAGGPLLSLDAGGCPYLVGVHNFGRGCVRSEAPGVYARVSHYAEWIASVISRPSSATRTGPIGLVASPQAVIAPETQAQAVHALADAIMSEARSGTGRVAPLAAAASPAYAAANGGERRVDVSVRSAVTGRLILVEIDENGAVLQRFPNGCFPEGLLVHAGPEPQRVPGDHEAGPTPGARRLIALIAPERFPFAETVAAPSRVERCEGPTEEAAPVAYLLDLRRQVRSARADPSTADAIAAGETVYELGEP